MIPEDVAMHHLEMLLDHSEPGATMHYLHVVSAPRDAMGPFGTPDPAKLETAIYAIAPTGDVNVPEFIANVVKAATVEAHHKGATPVFAALSQEMWGVAPEDADDEVARLAKVGRLHEHPAAREITLVYGACRDGRRWRGRRFLSGPKAGTREATDLLVGRPYPGEAGGIACAALVRQLVGL